MKTYEKPTLKIVELRTEERIACLSGHDNHPPVNPSFNPIGHSQSNPFGRFGGFGRFGRR